MNTLLEKFKAAWPNLVWFLAGAILLINPAHIDNFAVAHPKWSGVILALWAAVLAWAQKTRPQPATSTQPDMSQAGQNPSSQKQVYLQGRRQ